jgi:hypothetical protein
MQVDRKISNLYRINSSRNGAGTCCARNIQVNNGRFDKQAMQATIEGLDVYTSFVKLLGLSSRNFTTWRPDLIAMKIGAIIEVTSIRRTDLRHRLVTLAGRSPPTIAENLPEAVIALTATVNGNLALDSAVRR